MAVTTRDGKQTIDPPRQSGVENVIRGDDEVVEFNDELEDKTGKEVEAQQKVTPMTTPPPPLPQRLLKKTEDSKYWNFITMLN